MRIVLECANNYVVHVSSTVTLYILSVYNVNEEVIQ